MDVTITHDNGNHVCFSHGAVYVRQDNEFFGPDGNLVPGVGDIVRQFIDGAVNV